MSNPFNPEPLERFAAILNDAPLHTRLARSLLSFLAKHIGNGYYLVPMAWTEWTVKTANGEEYLAKLSSSASFRGGLHIGKAEMARRCAAEIKALSKT